MACLEYNLAFLTASQSTWFLDEELSMLILLLLQAMWTPQWQTGLPEKGDNGGRGGQGGEVVSDLGVEIVCKCMQERDIMQRPTQYNIYIS